MKKTCLYDIEKEYDAKTAPVAGWNLAKNFPGGATAEVKHTLENCSVFDRCHTMRVRICGEGMMEKLSGAAGKAIAVPSAVSIELEDVELTVIAMAENDLLVLADNENTVDKLVGFLGNVEVSNLSDQLAQLEIAGKKLVEVMADFDVPEEEIPQADAVVRRPVAEVNSIMICNHRFQVPALTLVFTSEYAEGMWEEFVDTYPVKPAGYAAYDTLTENNNSDSTV